MSIKKLYFQQIRLPRKKFLPITYLLTYLLIYLLTYLLTYFNHVACSVALQPTAQLDAGSVAFHSLGFPTRKRKI